MGYYNVRKNVLTAWQILLCNLVFQGYDDDYIAEKTGNIWNEDGSVNKQKLGRIKTRNTKFMKTDQFLEYYRSIVTEYYIHNFGKAVRKIHEQVDSNIPWLANKAANDVLTRFGDVIMGKDENAITVKIEGMPEIGTPNDAAENPTTLEK